MPTKSIIEKIDGVDCKLCSKCRLMIPVSGFNKNNKGGVGLKPRCKKCTAADSKISYQSLSDEQRRNRKEKADLWEKNNREREREKERIRYHKNKDKTRRKIINHRFKSKGWTKDAYENQYKEQNGNCAICGVHKDKLVIDHCHTTKNIRGLLCSNCNTGIGLFKDNIEAIRKAANYLEQNIPLLKAV